MLEDLFTLSGLAKAIIVLGVLYLVLRRLRRKDEVAHFERDSGLKLESFEFRGPCPGDDGDGSQIYRRVQTRDAAPEPDDTKFSVSPLNPPMAMDEAPKPKPRPRRQSQTKVVSEKSWMPEIVTGVLLTAALFIILRESYNDASQKFAFTTVGTVLGYWLKR